MTDRQDATIPPSICVIPFIHLSNKPLGEARFCCFAPNHEIFDRERNSMNLGKDSIEKIWNSESITSFRRQMLNGEKPKACEYCWQEEKSGKLSKRQNENEAYLQKNLDQIEEARLHNGRITKTPIYLDIRLGNTCNLKCRSCSPTYSSSISKEVHEKWDDAFEIKRELKIDHSPNRDWSSSLIFENNLKQILPTLDQIYISGGEPSIIPAVIRFLETCVSSGDCKHIHLRFNTNISLLPKAFYGLIVEFQKVTLSASLDAIGDRLSYLRHPLSWLVAKENLEKLTLLPTHVQLEINCTVSIMNVLYLEELFIFLRNLELSSGRRIDIIIGQVHEPDYFRIELLSESLKAKACQALNGLINSGFFRKSQIRDLPSIIETLNGSNEDLTLSRKRFSTYTKYLDAMRNENLESCFPELAELLV